MMEEVQVEDCIGEDVPSGLLFPSEDEKEDFQMTHEELEQIQQALKNEKFRRLLDDYAEEMQDPKTRTTFQSELRQLEKQKGNVVHFLNPVAGFVLKTSVDGDKKAFINVCSNPMIRKMSFQKATQANVSGAVCSIPFAQSPVREDVDKAGRRCLVYDVVFHPNTLALCKTNEKLQAHLQSTALDAVEKSFNVTLDRNNVRKPKLRYKGMKHATMIKYKIGDEPPKVLDPDQLNTETPPQPQEKYFQRKDQHLKESNNKQPNKKQGIVASTNTNPHRNSENENPRQQVNSSSSDTTKIEWTEPKYSLKYRSHVDMQDFCFDNQREGRSIKPIPQEIVLTVDLPMLKDSTNLEADVLEGGWDFELKAERRAHYRLNLRLPFQVYCDKSKASFDMDKRKLIIIMKTVQKLENYESIFSRPSDLLEEVSTIRHQQNDNQNDSKEPTLSSGINLEEKKDEMHYSESGDHADCCNDQQQEQNDPNENDLQKEPAKWINGDIVVKSILKRHARSRSMSESYLDDRNSHEEDFMSLESLHEYDETTSMGGEMCEKSVRFNEAIQQQLYRSNSSILGQRKKNQRKSKNKRKARSRLSSEGSVSSLDDHEDNMFSMSKSLRSNDITASARLSQELADAGGQDANGGEDEGDDDDDNGFEDEYIVQ